MIPVAPVMPTTIRFGEAIGFLRVGELYAGAFSAGAALPVSTNSRRWCRRIAHWVLHLRKLPPAFGQPRWANSIRVRPLSVGEILNDASVPTESPGPSMQRQRNSSG